MDVSLSFGNFRFTGVFRRGDVSPLGFSLVVAVFVGSVGLNSFL